MPEEVDALYLTLIAISVFFTVLIVLTIIVFAIRYRRRSENETATGDYGIIAT